MEVYVRGYNEEGEKQFNLVTKLLIWLVVFLELTLIYIGCLVFGMCM